jgi:phage terminase large subunit
MVGFQDTTATKKVFSLNKRIRAVSGGTSASKTISILVWCIDYGQSVPNEIISVVSESFPHLEDGAIRDFKNIMRAQGYWEEDRWHATKHEYTFDTGTVLEFTSVDTYGKAHGPRRDVLFMNEANYLTYQIADQLITRTRKIVWMDWNPVEEFWFYTEMLNRRDDVDFLTLTYLDNEALDPITIQEIESHKSNKSWWQVYGLGQLGEIETRIYKGWQIIDEVPHEARLVRTGGDYGYTNDPSVGVDIYEYNGGYVLDEVFYQKGLLNSQIADILKNKQVKVPCAFDPAEPKSNDELKTHGITMLEVSKGPGSVNQGIQWVQGQKISVTKRSVNVIKDYRNYNWKTDRDGKIINEPEHTYSHSMDAIRYGMQTLRPMEKETVQAQQHMFRRNFVNRQLNSTK